MKHKSIIKSIFAVVALCAAGSLFAATETVDGITWTYTVSDGKAEIGGGSRAIPRSTTGAITIPSTLGGYPVTGIGYSAFSGCTNITSITIPNSVTNIGDRAFYGCEGMTSVTIPNSVTSIGVGAFAGCSGLKSFVVASSNANYKAVSGLLLTKDGKTLVAVPCGLTSVTIPSSVTNIGECAFSGCTNLTSVTIPDSVTRIGEGAFSGCRGLADANGFVVVRNVLYDYHGTDSAVTKNA